MVITWSNYESILPESIWDQFCRMANANARRHLNRTILYRDKQLQYDND
jgi:hypothetical protein